MHLQNLNGFCLVLFGCNVFASVFERITNRKAMQINASGAIASFGGDFATSVKSRFQSYCKFLRMFRNSSNINGSDAIASFGEPLKSKIPRLLQVFEGKLLLLL